ncbi:Osmotin, thaumatin-like protein [Gymnopus androsaceus JB14]|uniref:Osmotin, thaumatin-like protein n=1 Tax=Gymnopus androsaceus JB14 TaxID=1447944 RepID=A0A6A4HUJ2_9AGAR|nr:Osmotin, thaumatin-like protein [Gymnopus androsaceus JB14]
MVAFIQSCFVSALFFVSFVSPTLAAPLLFSRQDSAHTFTLINQCTESVTPIFANTACGYSPRCDGAGYYSATQPGTIAGGGGTATATAPYAWVGRLFAQTGSCGASGEGCTMTEFNLDTGSAYTAQNYDISNIQGFTQSISIEAAGCDTVTCTSADCGCSEAYPIGDESGCGDDLANRACGPGGIAFTITFCP